MSDVIKPRRGTAAHWTSSNPILDENEIGRETDTGRWKLGVTGTHWNDLPYESFGRAIEEVTEQVDASYRVQLTDISKTVECNYASANDLTLPVDNDVAVPVNANMAAFWKGLGQPSVFAEVGAKLNGIPSGITKISQRYGRIWIRKAAVDEWYVGGDMTGVIPPNSGGDISVITILGVTYILHRFLVNDDLVLTIPVTNADWLLVAGGAGGLISQSQQGTDGGNSSFNGNTSVGGGGGGNGANNAGKNGRPGGSGGGGGWYTSTGGAGTAGQGYAGGNQAGYSDNAGSGGGGAGGVGGTASGGTPGAGGAGLTRSLDGNSIEYAKGGTGGENFTAPVANTGSGGYGAYASGASGATGANGVLLLRYQA
jgi:hypothetical protein